MVRYSPIKVTAVMTHSCVPPPRKFQLGDRVHVLKGAARDYRLRRGFITRLGFGQYEVTFEDDREPGYAEIESPWIQRQDDESRCPMCNAATVQPLTSSMYQTNNRITWHECVRCMRVWHQNKQKTETAPAD
jgi:hypothetical protein